MLKFMRYQAFCKERQTSAGDSLANSNYTLFNNQHLNAFLAKAYHLRATKNYLTSCTIAN